MQTKEKIKYQFYIQSLNDHKFLSVFSPLKITSMILLDGFLVKPIVSLTKNLSKALTKYERPKKKRDARQKCLKNAIFFYA